MLRRKTSLALSAAPPFPGEPAELGFAGRGRERRQASYRLRRFFYKNANDLRLRWRRSFVIPSPEACGRSPSAPVRRPGRCRYRHPRPQRAARCTPVPRPDGDSA